MELELATSRSKSKRRIDWANLTAQTVKYKQKTNEQTNKQKANFQVCYWE